jgi:hypothetical protein
MTEMLTDIPPLIQDRMTQAEKNLFATPTRWGTPADAVARGAAYLDRVMPAWADRVTINTLDLSRTCACVLGQLFETDAVQSRINHTGNDFSKYWGSGYEAATVIFNWQPTYHEKGYSPADFFGFDYHRPTGDMDEDGQQYIQTGSYNELTQLWTEAIQARTLVDA